MSQLSLCSAAGASRMFVVLLCLFLAGAAGTVHAQDARFAEAARKKIDEIVRELGPDDTPEAVEKIFESLSRHRRDIYSPDEKIAFYDEIVRRFGDHPLAAARREAIRVLGNKAYEERKRGNATAYLVARTEEARREIDEIVREFGPDDTPEAMKEISEALRPRVWDRRSGEKIILCDEIVRRFGNHPLPAGRVIAVKALEDKADEEQRQADYQVSPSALAVYEEIVRRFGGDAHPDVRVAVVRVLVEKASAQFRRHSRDRPKHDSITSALATYEDITRRFGEDPHPAVRAEVAKALIQKSKHIGKRGPDIVYDEIDWRFGKEENATVRTQVVDALFAKVDFYSESNDYRKYQMTGVLDEINRRFGDDPKVRRRVAAVFLAHDLREHVIQRFWKDEDPDVQETLVLALFEKAEGLRNQGEASAAAAIQEEIFQRFGKNPKTRKAIINKLFEKASAARNDGKQDVAIAVYDEIIRHFGAEETLPDDVIEVFFRKASLLENAKEIIALYDLIEQRSGEEKPEAIQKRIMEAMLGNVKNLLLRNHKTKAATVLQNEVERRLGKKAAQDTLIQVLFSKANTLCIAGDSKAALAVYDEILRRFENPDRSIQIVDSMFRSGMFFQRQGHLGPAIAFYDKIERRFGKDETRRVRLQIAEMLLWRAEALARQGNLAAALALYDEIVQRFGGFKKESQLGGALALLPSAIGESENDDSFRQTVAQALYNKAIILGAQGDHKGEEALYAATLAHVSVGGKQYIFVPGAKLSVRVRLNQARLLEARRDFQGAMAIYDEIMEKQLGRAPHRALLRKGLALERMGDRQAAEAIYVEFGRYYGNGQSAEERLARAMLQEASNSKAAIAAYEAIDRDHAGHVPEALLQKGRALLRQGKRKEALAVYAEIDRRYGGHTAETTREVVLRAAAARAVERKAGEATP